MIMKKFWKILLIIIGVIILLVALTLLMAGPIAKYYIQKHDTELVGREITIDKLRVNPFAGKIKLNGFTLYEDDGQHAFVQIGEFKTNVKLRDLLHRQFTVQMLQLSGLKVNVEQNRTWFNFNSMIDFFASGEPKEEKEQSQSDFGVTLYNILVDQSFIRYADVAMGSEFLLNDISVKIPMIDLASLKTHVGLDLCLGEDANLHTQLRLSENAEEYTMNIQLENLDIGIIEPYLKQSLAVDSLKGKLDFNLQALGRTEHILDFDMTGDITLRDLSLQDNSGYGIGSIDSIHADIQKFSISQNFLDLQRLHLSGLHSEYIIRADNTTNFDIILGKQKVYNDTTIFEKIGDSIASEFNEVQESKPLRILVEDLRLSNTRLLYADYTLPSPFQYEITNLTMTSRNFSIDKENTVELQALLNQVGKLNVIWKGSVASLDNQNLTLMLNNLKLADFSPFCVQMFGYPLENGTLSFNSQNIITNRNLRGINKMDLASPEAGDKLKDYEPEIKYVPLKLGFYLLTDKDNKVSLDLPVSGSLDDPEFSYRRAILKVLGSLIVKVCTAPFRLLSSDGDNQYIDYDFLHPDFSAAEYSQLDDIAITMLDKADLTLELDQQVNYDEVVQDLCNLQLQRDYYCSRHPEIDSMGMDFLTSETIRSIKLSDKDLWEYTARFAEGGEIHSKQDVATVALAVYGNKSDELMTRFMDRKNEKLLSYLTAIKGISRERITINKPTVEAMKEYKKECRYEIHVGLGDEKNQ